MSQFEDIVFNRLKISKLALPHKEYKFHPERRWKFDFAFPLFKIAIECEGGTWMQGRHTRGKGFAQDCEKYNAALKLGWKVLRYTPDMIDDIIKDIKEILDSDEPKNR